MGNLYAKEMKRNLKRFLIWVGATAALILFTLALVPTMTKSAETVRAYLDVFPEVFRKAFGIDFDTWSNVLGIYVTYFVFYDLVMGGIFSIYLAMDILAKEENRKSADFLLARPITRVGVVGGKALAHLSYVFLFNLGATLTGYIGMEIFKTSPYPAGPYFILCTYGFLFTLLFGGLGFFISILVKRGRSMTGAGIGVVLACYFIDALSKAVEKAEGIGYISPFRFVDIEVLSPDYGFTWWRLLYLIGVPALFFALTFAVYRRKDILT